MQPASVKPTIPSDWKLWFQSLSLASYVYIIVALYIAGLDGLVTPRYVNLALGDTATIMVILSMGMSSITYYWHVADHAMLFRKHFGIIGFVFSLFHFIFSLVLIEQHRTLTAFIWDPHNTVAFFTGLGAFIILTFMTVISHRLAVKYLGGRVWRVLLRLGYVAILLSVVHIMWRNWGEWFGWLTGKSDSLFPPMGLLITVAAVSVCILRIGMYFGTKKA